MMKIQKINSQLLSNFRCIGNDYDISFPSSLDDLDKISTDAFIIGSGTNTLFLNKQSTQIISLQELNNFNTDGNIVNAEAGATLPMLIKELKKKHLGGLCFSYPISATIGGAIRQNLGAYDQTISDLIIEVTCFNKDNKQLITLTNKECEFGYRTSVLKNSSLVIISALLALPSMPSTEITKLCNTYKTKRENNYQLNNNLGSIFKNPKGLSAGKLIDECGLKGFTHKSASISNDHANVIVAIKETKAEDILALMKIVQETVKSKKNINLEPEITIY